MSSKLKVLQVIPRLDYGGAEIGCYDLAHYLSEQKSKSYIATSGGKLTKYINKKKVKLFKIPVHSKNPILMILNIFILSLIVLFYRVNVIHVRSRAPAWSCYFAAKITRCKLVTTFHGTYNFNSSLKKYYNSIMLKSDCVIAGSNFIFKHISENYPEHVPKMKKFLVIFRGINTEYYDPNNINKKERTKFFAKLNKEQDSIGAKILINISGMPSGIGSPVFSKLDAELAKAMMSVNAVKAVEIGTGCDVVTMRGSENRDKINKSGFESNNSGGILGGISNGDEINVFVSLKPTSSISQKTKTLDINNDEVELQVKGRHDPCVGLRATPILEAMAMMCMLDQILIDRGQCFNVQRDFKD